MGLPPPPGTFLFARGGVLGIAQEKYSLERNIADKREFVEENQSDFGLNLSKTTEWFFLANFFFGLFRFRVVLLG